MIDAGATDGPSGASGGMFVALEGPEGAGKSTQAAALARAVEAAGFSVILTREPGGTAIGEQVRRIVLDPGNCAMLAEAEVLLYAAARAQHVGEVLRPALAAGSVVICDRYVDSTYAYQGGGRMLDMGSLRRVQEYATRGLLPHLRILLDLPVEAGLERRFTGPETVNRMDLADLAFHRRVREAFLALAAADPDGWVRIDASATTDDVTAAVLEAVMPRLPRR